MVEKINKQVIQDEVKSPKNIIVLIVCMFFGILLTYLCRGADIWYIIVCSCLVVIAPLVMLIIFILDRKKDINVFKS